MRVRDWDARMVALNKAIEQAEATGKPADDGYGNRARPSGADGIPIVGRVPKAPCNFGEVRLWSGLSRE